MENIMNKQSRIDPRGIIVCTYPGIEPGKAHAITTYDEFLAVCSYDEHDLSVASNMKKMFEEKGKHFAVITKEEYQQINWWDEGVLMAAHQLGWLHPVIDAPAKVHQQN